MKLRRRGQTWDQISGIMANPPIGEQVSAKLLNRVFASKRKPSSAASGTPVKSPQPHADRIVIDPLTGKGDDATNDCSLRPFDTWFGAGYDRRPTTRIRTRF
jgi:hypothetical protein